MVAGRDGGAGTLDVLSVEGRVVAVVGEYAFRNATTIAIEIAAVGTTFEDMATGRTATTPDALLPLVVRDAPWNVGR